MSSMLVGYFSYDIIRYIEKIPDRCKDDLRIPDVRLSRPKNLVIYDNLKKNNIEYIVADWTNKDENILKVLNNYGRSGVPLYVFWKPGMQDPIILPAILTENLVLETLNKY